MNAYVIDLESEKLYPQYGKVWTIIIKQVGEDRWLKLNPFKSTKEQVRKQILDFIFIEENPIIIGHNYIGFDAWVLWKEYDLSFQLGPDLLDDKSVRYVDTLYLSQFLLPDREGKHSLKSWGLRNNDEYEKIDYKQIAIDLGVIPKNAQDGDEFSVWTPEMDLYCSRDCEVTEITYLKLIKELQEQNTINQFHNGQKSAWLMYAQGFTGFHFDQKWAKELQPIIEKMIQQLRDEVEPQLPTRPLKKTEQKNYIFPAKIYNQDGSFSANMKKFIIKHNAELLDNGRILLYGEEYEIKEKQEINLKLPISLDDQFELKDFFIEQGWVPTLWNYKTDPNTGRKLRDSNKQLIPTSPKIQDNQKICPNLLELEGDIAKKVVKFLSLKNRLSTLISSKDDTKGWLNNPRLQYDGRISAGVSGIASTHRWKHTTVVNVPKADPTVLLGNEFRRLWNVEEGNKLVSCDAAALENRCEAHWVYKYDNGKTAEEILSGDPHSKNAKAFYPQETINYDVTSDKFNKDDLGFKPYRNLSKNGKYCLPLSTQILTKNGWKYFNEVNIGDVVYSLKDEKIKEDIILEKHLLLDEIFKWSNKTYSFECTNNHRWYGWKRRWAKKGEHRKKEYGFFESKDLNQEHNLIFSAKFENGNSDITPNEAKLIGYILSDGGWEWSKKSEITSSSNGNKKAVKCTISQSITKFHNEIRQCIIDNNIEFNEYTKKGKNGDIFIFDLKSAHARKFLDKVVGERKNKHDINWERWVLSLSIESRSSFIQGFWEGDGISNKPDSLEISQIKGNILNGIHLAVYMTGRRVSIQKHSDSVWSKKECVVVKRLKNSHLTCQELKKESLGVQDVFCITTNNGSFIIKQDNNIMLTGNCITYGGAPKKLATTLRKKEEEGKKLYDAFWSVNTALKSLKEDLENFWEKKGGGKWILAVDGRRLYSRSKHSLINLLFQSTGAIIMDTALILFHNKMGKMYIDELGRPYYKYKDGIVKRVVYVHDEWGSETTTNIVEEIAKIKEQCIADAGKVLKIAIPLAGEAKIGLNWEQTH